ncbi:MAG TPA: hypothetical protein EYN08_06360 [Gammaproteobacteria bacterium]|nr:hypothetical protein [Gammaproteobacteria bacterium]
MNIVGTTDTSGKTITDLDVTTANTKLNELRATAKKTITDLAKQSDVKIELTLAENEMIPLVRKQKAFEKKVSESITADDKFVNERVLADINKKIEILQLKITELGLKIKGLEAQTPTSSSTPQCSTIGAPDSPDSSSSGLDENGKVIYGATSNAKTTVSLLKGDAYHYKENRVRWRVYGTLGRKSENSAKPKHRKGENTLHVLAAKRWDAMVEAFIKEHPSLNIPLVTSGWRQIPPVRWKKLQKLEVCQAFKHRKTNLPYENLLAAHAAGKTSSIRYLFEQYLIDVYTSVAAGQKQLAWFSPHSTGLAIDISWRGPLVGPDIKYNKKTYSEARIEPGARAGASPGKIMKASVLHNWMRKNAYKFGLTPYLNEAWHWEIQMPISAYKTGNEFTQNFGVYVSEKSDKTGKLTNNSMYAGQEFT